MAAGVGVDGWHSGAVPYTPCMAHGGLGMFSHGRYSAVASSVGHSGRSSRKFIPCARPYGSWESFRKIPKLFSILFFTGKCDVAFAISFRFMLLFFVMPTTITLE